MQKREVLRREGVTYSNQVNPAGGKYGQMKY